MFQKTSVHGFIVSYEPIAIHGIYYLRNDLDLEEAKVFFDQAKLKGKASFEDDQERQYTLFYQNNAYLLTKR